MKILLINPQRMLKNPKNQYTSIPIGLISLASFLQINGYETEVLDTIGEDLKNYEPHNEVYRCGMSNHKVCSVVENYKPDVVGISCSFTPRFPNVVQIARLVKQFNPNIPVVVGGMHATVCAEDVLKEPSIDFVIMGEAEVPFLNLLEKLKTPPIKGEDLHAVSFRVPEGIWVSKERTLIDNLDSLPIPAYDLIPMEKYFRSGVKRDSLTEEKRQSSVVTSRGCPFQCSFCSSQSMWGNVCRQRSPMHILSEIEMLLNSYGVKEIAFEDDNLTLNKDRISQLCREIIHRNLKFKWTTPNGIHIANLDLPLIRLMKSSGCKRLNFGIESGDEHILNDVMNKKISLSKIKEVVKMCSDEGIVTLGYFVLGMPGETEQSLIRTIEFAKSLSLHEIGLFVATPFPQTTLEKMCKEGGYLKKDYREIKAEDDIENQIFFETPMLPTEKLIFYKNVFLKEFYKKKVFERPFYYTKRAFKNPRIVRKLWQG
jgi:magnesium-protoporphyrin IX monomethyl ester (oxidative) cyclase